MFSQTERFFAGVPSLERAKEIAAEAMRENNIDGTEWLQEVAHLRASHIDRQSAEIEIQYFVLDDGCFCGVAEEIMCELAIDVAEECNNPFIFLGGYTNGCSGYLPSAVEYDRGGYEVLHSYLIYYKSHERVMPLNRDTASKLVETVVQQWNRVSKDCKEPGSWHSWP